MAQKKCNDCHCWTGSPLKCHPIIMLHSLVSFLLAILFTASSFSIFRGNLLCGPIYFSTRREKKSKNIVQSPQVSTQQFTLWWIHRSEWTQACEEECNHTKSIWDFQCMCLLIPNLHFEAFHNHYEAVLMSGQNRLMLLEGNEDTYYSCLKIIQCLFTTSTPYHPSLRCEKRCFCRRLLLK